MRINLNQLKIFILWIVIAVPIVQSCRRSPTHIPHGRRTRGDNGYKLIIADDANGYIPGKTYTLLLLGARTHTKVQHFTHFTITAEAHTAGRFSQPAGPKRVGRFQLFSDSLSKFNDQCVNTVSEADDLPKTEIQVMWVAPATGSGCVSLSAMVYENPKSWFTDDGQLTKVVCEKKPDILSIQKECCACDEAKYNFIFEGIWSNETHPKDFPFAIWLTHFSDIVGATHESNFTFWGENHIATDGFRSLAEWGSPSALENELRAKGSRLRSLIKAPGLWYPNVNTNTTSKFRVDRKHHKVSMVSMFGPSPDWVVGISGVDLCDVDCNWKESMTFDLYPWDSGTDSGITYMSPNTETQPRERMHRITTMYPEDPRAPFYNPNSNEMIPLAKLYLQREKIISRSCDDEFLNALQQDIPNADNDDDQRTECRVTEYGPWSQCSVTCGKGLRMRSRKYTNPKAAQRVNCSQQLISKEMCVADIPECEQPTDDEDEGENLARSAIQDNGDGTGNGICKTTLWSDWSECSASCGIGITMRTRAFINHIGRKRCPHVTIVEKKKCMQPECKFEQIELPDPMCPTTQWSDWSPCSASCGRGVTIRTRLLLLEDGETKANCTNHMELHQQKACSVPQNCEIDQNMARDICTEQKDTGPCRGNYLRYAYNHELGQCESFTYGGCRGNRNNFLTSSECVNTCGFLGASYNQQHSATTEQGPMDCVMSEWSGWSDCSVPCGLGHSERHRYILREPRNGGKPCPKQLVKKRRCNVAEC